MKKFILQVLFIFSSFFLFAREEFDLNVINASWSTVLPGKVIAQPLVTDSGFVLISDARNIMTFSTDGKLISEKPLKKINKPVFTVLPGDLIAAITNYGKQLTLLNPDGKELWKKDLDNKITLTPVAGRDGRIFLRYSEGIYCFGINGIQKWQLETPEQSNLDVQELPDGTLVVFLAETEDSKTKAIRVSPFGEILENITFAGEIVTSLTTPKGILLTFTDGTCGLFSLENNVSTHKWILKTDKLQDLNKDFFILSQNRQKVVYIRQTGASAQVNYINLDNGEIEKSFEIPDLNNIIFSTYNEEGVFLADKNHAYFYNNSGRFLWSGKMPEAKSRDSYNYIIYTRDNNFILFGTNWTINGFKTSQSDGKNNAVVKEKSQKKSKYQQVYKTDNSVYSNLFKDNFSKILTSDQQYNELLAGNYGPKEIEYTTELLNACIAYQSTLTSTDFGTRVDKSVFETDSAGLEKLLRLFSPLGTDTFIDYEVMFLKNEKNKSYIRLLLKGIKDCGYDPDGKLLSVLEYLSENVSIKDEQILCDICDATASVCTYMGNSYFEDKGQMILSNFLYPKYNSKTRNYARSALQTLIN